MSYLTTPELDKFDKAIISFWFRVSQEAMDAAQKEYDDFWDAWTPEADQQPPPLLGLVPLVTFGKEGTSRISAESDGKTEVEKTFTTVTNTVMTFSDSLDMGAVAYYTYTINWFPDPNAGGTYTQERNYYKTTFSYSAKPGKPTNPSFIAIDGNGQLRINFESTQTGDVTLAAVMTSFTSRYHTQETVNQCWTYQFLANCDAGSDTVTAPFGMCGILVVVFAMVGYRMLTAVTDKLVDQGSSPRVDHPSKREYGSGPGDMGTGAISFTVPKALAADTWHHVVVSVDMTGGSASNGYAAGEGSSWEDAIKRITATSLLYVAVDDVNYPTGGNLWPDTNKVATGGATSIAFSSQAADYDDKGNMTPQGPVPSYKLEEMSVPAGEVGIPAIKKYVDKIRSVDMAEFLLFSGAVLDTSIEQNRRPFITRPDKNGFQHPPNVGPLFIPFDKKAIGDPATWEPGADNPAYVPPLFDPSAWPTTIKLDGGATTTADIDFTKCSWNWQMGRNIGTLEGKVVRTGRVEDSFPDPKIAAAPAAGS